MQTESKEKSVYNSICPVKAQSKWNENQKEKNQKANPCKDSEKNLWCSVSVFWFKLCSRRLTERKAAILSIYNIYIIGIWIYISLAIIRSVSLRLQNEGQKKLTEYHRCTRSLWHGFFWPLSFDLYMDSKRICKRDRLRLLRKWRNNVRRPEGKPIIQFRVYCPKESKCHALARFVLFVRLVFEKNIRVY